MHRKDMASPQRRRPLQGAGSRGGSSNGPRSPPRATRASPISTRITTTTTTTTTPATTTTSTAPTAAFIAPPPRAALSGTSSPAPDSPRNNASNCSSNNNNSSDRPSLASTTSSATHAGPNGKGRAKRSSRSPSPAPPRRPTFDSHFPSPPAGEQQRQRQRHHQEQRQQRALAAPPPLPPPLPAMSSTAAAAAAPTPAPPSVKTTKEDTSIAEEKEDDKESRIAALERELAIMEAEFVRELDKLARAESESAAFWQGRVAALEGRVRSLLLEREGDEKGEKKTVSHGDRGQGWCCPRCGCYLGRVGSDGGDFGGRQEGAHSESVSAAAAATATATATATAAATATATAADLDPHLHLHRNGNGNGRNAEWDVGLSEGMLVEYGEAHSGNRRKTAAATATAKEEGQELQELRQAWERAREQVARRDEEILALRAQVRGLKEWVSASTRADGQAQTSDQVFGEAMARLGNGLQNWVLMNFRKARIDWKDQHTLTEADLSTADEDTVSELARLAPMYEELASSSKIHLLQSIVSRLLVEHVFDAYFVGLPCEVADQIKQVEAYLATVASSPESINQWRSHTLGILKRDANDKLQAETAAVADTVVSHANRLLDRVTNTSSAEARDQGLRALVASAVELSRLLAVQKAVFRVEVPEIVQHQRTMFDAETMEDIGGEDEDSLADRDICCVAFPGIVKRGDESGGHLQYRNVIAKAKVLCSPE